MGGRKPFKRELTKWPQGIINPQQSGVTQKLPQASAGGIRGSLAGEYQHPKLVPKIRDSSPLQPTQELSRSSCSQTTRSSLPLLCAEPRAGRGAARRLPPNPPAKNGAGWEVSAGRVWCEQTRSQGVKVILQLFLSEILVVIWNISCAKNEGWKL